MESQAGNLEEVLKSSTLLHTKLALLAKLKANIKHQHVPPAAISPCFEVVRIAISSPELLDQGFSILSHLTKRLLLQDEESVLASQAIMTYRYVIDCFGDTKDRVRTRAAQALTDFWTTFHTDVEQVLRDIALASGIPAVKENAMQWIVKMNKDQGLQFKSFVPSIITCLGDTNANVSEAARVTLIQLFRDAPDRAKADVRKHLMHPSLDATVVSQICAELDVLNPTAQSQPSTQLNSSQQSHSSVPSNERVVPYNIHSLSSSVSNEQALHTMVPSEKELEAEEIKSTDVYSARELEDIFHDMHPYFEGKETDQNWERRKNSVVKLRNITKGNSPTEFTTTYLNGIRTLLEGILKVVTSLRTTPSSNGCSLVQEIACAIGSNIDPMVEILLQSLVKLCGGTKTIDAQNGDRTIDAIMANASYSTRLTQHIWNACQDKNVRPRSYATGWLKTIINKYAHHKHALEHGNGLDLIEKCIRKGLLDANLGVRESMRDTYWAYWSLFPGRSEVIMNSLESKQQEALKKAPSNPDPNKTSIPASVVSTTRVAPLKETIAARKRAKLAELKRPESAQSFTAKKSTASSTLVRPAKSMATAPKTTSSSTKTVSAQIGSLSSAPMRPTRLTKKLELSRATSTTTLDKTPIKATDDPTILTSMKKEGLSPLAERKSRIKSTTYASMIPTSPKGNVTSSVIDRTPVKPVFNIVNTVSSKKENSLASSSDRKKLNSITVDSPNMAPTKLGQVLNGVEESNKFEVHDSRSPTKHKQTKDLNSPIRLQTTTPDLPQTQIRGRKERQAPQDDNLDQFNQLSVYEDPKDPEQTLAQDVLSEPKAEFAVLGEMPINLGNSLPLSPDLFIAQKLLESGIGRVQSGTLDLHGYRKLHGLIKLGGPVWTDGRIFEQLLIALLSRLKATPENGTPITEFSSTDLRGQALIAIRILLSQNPKQFSKFCPQALCAILQARQFFTLSTHLVLGLEKLSSEVVGLVDDPKLCIEAVLELLGTEGKGTEGNRTITMGLVVLAGLLGRASDHLTDDIETRLTQLSLVSLRASGTDVRMAAVDYSMAVFDTIKPESRFWKMASSAPEDARSLLAYFLAKRIEP